MDKFPIYARWDSSFIMKRIETLFKSGRTNGHVWTNASIPSSLVARPVMMNFPAASVVGPYVSYASHADESH